MHPTGMLSCLDLFHNSLWERGLTLLKKYKTTMAFENDCRSILSWSCFDRQLLVQRLKPVLNLAVDSRGHVLQTALQRRSNKKWRSPIKPRLLRISYFLRLKFFWISFLFWSIGVGVVLSKSERGLKHFRQWIEEFVAKQIQKKINLTPPSCLFVDQLNQYYSRWVNYSVKFLGLELNFDLTICVFL